METAISTVAIIRSAYLNCNYGTFAPIPTFLEQQMINPCFNKGSMEHGTFYVCERVGERYEPISVLLYIASHLRVAPENVGLQKKQKCNTFACHTCNEVRLCVLGIRKKEVGNTKR
jgi:hypothetical protein